jgi:hypothetical protein
MIPVRLALIGGAVAAVLAVAVVLVLWGASGQRARDAAQDAKEYRQTMERMQDATDLDRSPDAVLERLRQHAKP